VMAVQSLRLRILSNAGKGAMSGYDFPKEPEISLPSKFRLLAQPAGCSASYRIVDFWPSPLRNMLPAGVITSLNKK
jgi:hypothetical protein